MSEPVDRYGIERCRGDAIKFLVFLCIALIVALLFVIRSEAQGPEYGWDWWATPQASDETKYGLESPEFHDPVVIKRMRCNGYRTRGHPGYGHYAASRRGYWSR